MTVLANQLHHLSLIRLTYTDTYYPERSLQKEIRSILEIGGGKRREICFQFHITFHEKKNATE